MITFSSNICNPGFRASGFVNKTFLDDEDDEDDEEEEVEDAFGRREVRDEDDEDEEVDDREPMQVQVNVIRNTSSVNFIIFANFVVFVLFDALFVEVALN